MSAFAMRLLPTLFLILIMGFLPFMVHAQSPDSGVYEITDVTADVTADSAVHARDQAVKQGQRTAFEQLLQRTGVDPALAAKLSDDDISTLVQSFEVQNERSSPVRYIGIFTVQFRPSAVKNYLNSHNATYNDTRSKPVLVLPVTTDKGHAILWEETTKWRTAWDGGSHTDGLVPVVLPQGGLEDIAALSTDEAMSGKANALAALINKYQAGSALVAILNGDLTKPASSLTIEMRRYDESGNAEENSSLILAVPADKKDADNILPQAVKQVRAQLETDWRQEAESQDAVTNGGGESGQTSATQVPQPSAALSHLPVNIPIETLAEWEQIRQQLDHVPNIKHAEIITLARGLTNIELEFTGDVTQLQTALTLQNLSLLQNVSTGAWILQPATHASH